jgi:uncharacterized membrane protein
MDRAPPASVTPHAALDRKLDRSMTPQRKTHRTIAATGLLLVAFAGARHAAAQPARLYRIGDLPHSTSIKGVMQVRAVTDDGLVIGSGSDMNAQWYGLFNADTSLQAMRFSAASGESTGLGKFISAFNSSSAWGATADGSHVFGSSSTQINAFGLFNSRGFLWAAATGMTQLPIIPGDSELADFAGITCSTPDGSLLMGGCGSTGTYRWTAWPAGSAPYQFPDPIHSIFGEIEGVSDDARIVWGTGNQTSRALIWTQGAPALISVALPGATYSQALAVSGDGLTFIGNSDTLYQGQHLEHAFRYRADTGVVDLNLALHPELYNLAIGASRNGNIVVGSYSFTPAGAPAWQGYGVGWIWRSGTGITPLETYLTQELGLTFKGLLHPVATAISPSGRWIAGESEDPTDQEERIAWVVDTRVTASCYANCDGSTTVPVLNINDLVCFQTKFAAGDSYANCDGSTQPPVLNINDFVCFQTRFAAGCP